MSSRKTKSPRKQQQAAPVAAPTSFDFVADLTLRECLERLQAWQQSTRANYPKVSVALNPVDAHTYWFTIKRIDFDDHRADATGYLQQWEQVATHVAGEAWAVRQEPNWMKIVLVGCVPLPIMAAVPVLRGVALLYLGVLVAVMLAHRITQEPITLIQRLQAILRDRGG